MTDKEWWETVCEDVRQLVFNRLDTEEGITGDEAGQMAHAAEMAVRQAFERIQSADASDAFLATPPAKAEYQPKTGAKCTCKPGVQRDNCPACEGTGMVIDFAAIRARRCVHPSR